MIIHHPTHMYSNWMKDFIERLHCKHVSISFKMIHMISSINTNWITRKQFLFFSRQTQTGYSLIESLPLFLEQTENW